LTNFAVKYQLTILRRFLPFPIYLQPDPKLWQYCEFIKPIAPIFDLLKYYADYPTKVIIHSEDFGAEWRKIEGEDDVYQLVCIRKDKHPGLQGFFYTFPEAVEYDTKDLYKPHPTLPDHWIYYGRADSK